MALAFEIQSWVRGLYLSFKNIIRSFSCCLTQTYTTRERGLLENLGATLKSRPCIEETWEHLEQNRALFEQRWAFRSWNEEQFRTIQAVRMHSVYLAFKGEFPGCFKERLWCSLLLLFHLEASIKKCSSRLWNFENESFVAHTNCITFIPPN